MKLDLWQVIELGTLLAVMLSVFFQLKASHEKLGQKLELVTADIKEDIKRLEAKQDKSNGIKERLAVVEEICRRQKG